MEDAKTAFGMARVVDPAQSKLGKNGRLRQMIEAQTRSNT